MSCRPPSQAMLIISNKGTKHLKRDFSSTSWPTNLKSFTFWCSNFRCWSSLIPTATTPCTLRVTAVLTWLSHSICGLYFCPVGNLHTEVLLLSSRHHLVGFHWTWWTPGTGRWGSRSCHGLGWPRPTSLHVAASSSLGWQVFWTCACVCVVVTWLLSILPIPGNGEKPKDQERST